MPAWWLLARSEAVQRHPMRYGYVVGLIYSAATLWWISDVTALGIVFLIPYMALYPAIWFLLVARFLKPWTSRTNAAVTWQAIGGAALWVTLEWWRSWFLTGFDWNELGDSQATSIAFRQLAAFGGVHLLSFVLVMVNILWAEGSLAMMATLRERRVVRASLPFAVALFIVAAGFALGAHHLFRHRGEAQKPALSFACVQPNIPQIAGGGGRCHLRAANAGRPGYSGEAFPTGHRGSSATAHLARGDDRRRGLQRPGNERSGAVDLRAV